MPGKADAAVQYDNRREWPAAVGTTVAAKLCRQTGIRPRQIAGEMRWLLSREVWKLDQGTGRGGAGTEQRGKPDRQQGYPESEPHRATPRKEAKYMTTVPPNIIGAINNVERTFVECSLRLDANQRLRNSRYRAGRATQKGRPQRWNSLRSLLVAS